MDAEPVVAQRLVLPAQGGVAADAAALYWRGNVDVRGRTRCVVAAGGEATFATYFNAFPARIWQTVAGIDRIRLCVRAVGIGTHRLHALTADGATVVLAECTDEGVVLLDSGLLDEDVSWLWLETSAPDGDVTIESAEWLLPARVGRETSITVAITTMNRVEDCAELIRALGGEELTGVLSEVIVIDQGSEPVEPLMPGPLLENGVPLRVIVQENLGGSGGFSRGMIEATEGDTTHVLLLDDDVRIEPESVLRLRALASVAVGEPLLGAQMLSMLEPTVLHSMGERMDRRTMWWHATEPSLSSADLAHLALERTPALRRFRPVDFNGWWMCLIPTSVVRRLGASLPLFIKWDDAEYGLRAAERGYPSITVPGTALWHIPWTSKDDGLDWQAYFQLRNRIVTALVHERRPRRVLGATWAQDINHILCLQYGSARLRNAALQDILSGPEHLRETIRGGRTRAHRILVDAGQYLRPDPPGGAAGDRRHAHRAPAGAVAKALRLARVIAHQAARVRTPTREPEIVPRQAGKWWMLGLIDHADLRSATGSGYFRLTRSRRTAFMLLRESVMLRARLWFTWPSVSRRYRDAAPALASAASWRGVYAVAGTGASDDVT